MAHFRNLRKQKKIIKKQQKNDRSQHEKKTAEKLNISFKSYLFSSC
jgi:hypothetical protein